MKKETPLVFRSKFMDILLIINERPTGFNELIKRVSVSPSTLSRRISEMEEYRLIKSQISEEGRKRIEYTITKEGEEIIPLIRQIIELSQQVDDKIFKKKV